MYIFFTSLRTVRFNMVWWLQDSYDLNVYLAAVSKLGVDLFLRNIGKGSRKIKEVMRKNKKIKRSISLLFLSLYPSLPIKISLSISTYIYLTLYLHSISISISLPPSLSIYIYISIYLSLSISLFISIFISLSIYLSISLLPIPLILSSQSKCMVPEIQRWIKGRVDVENLS